MRRVFLMMAVSGTIFFTGCEKNEDFEPTKTQLLKADKGILCRGCGDWDKTDPEPGASSARVVSTDADSTSTPATPVRPVKRKK